MGVLRSSWLALALAWSVSCGEPGAAAPDASTAPTYRVDAQIDAAAPRRTPVPVVHLTDIFRPFQDLDDWFDLAAMYANPDIDLRAVIIDTAGAVSGQEPDGIPVEQLNRLTGRAVPYAAGARHAMQSPTDTLADDPNQAGIELLLRTLRDATTKIDIVSVGSCRDLAAAYNREPALFAHKVDRIYIFAGDGADDGFQEWNVGLDPHAFVRMVQQNPLDVYWIPCYCGGNWTVAPPYRGSFWQAQHTELCRDSAPGLLSYLVYGWARLDSDPYGFLSRPVDANLHDRFATDLRNLWCPAVFTHISDRQLVLDADSGRYTSLASSDVLPNHMLATRVFDWTDVELDVDARGLTHYGHSATSKVVHVFSQSDPATYSRAMTDITAAMLANSYAWPSQR